MGAQKRRAANGGPVVLDAVPWFTRGLGSDTNGRIVASAQDPSGETWQLWAADAKRGGV